MKQKNTTETRKKARSFGRRRLTYHLVGLSFVFPWLIGFLVLALYPFIQMIIYSFNTVTVTAKGIIMQPVGLEKYRQVLFVESAFRTGMLNYGRILLLVPVIVVLAIILSVLLNTKIPCKGLFRAIFFLPVILLNPPMYQNLQNMDAFELSGVNRFFVFQFINESLPPQLADQIMYVMLNIVVCLWYSGVQIQIFLSAMQKVDGNLYEAAMVDGANAWQKFWKITMPTLRPFILINTVYTIVILSDAPFNQLKGIMGDSVIFDARFGYGYAAAAAWLYFFVRLLVVFVAYLLVGRKEKPIYVDPETHARIRRGQSKRLARRLHHAS